MPDTQGYTDHESREYPFQVADVHVVGPGYHLLAPAGSATPRPADQQNGHARLSSMTSC
ncbi:BQ5605_C006g03841 [Microbotryum silenes-dioicae]|uniref:BQ5605_C006g03841 protein n=1 Tax=Microbotryum silenes-dioicae TaxID=796604 RepID=A0A2X0P7I7_9BASI|nr:BQ5605_C006g03841 [Microbotryum silenes-dioicae]